MAGSGTPTTSSFTKTPTIRAGPSPTTRASEPTSTSCISARAPSNSHQRATACHCGRPSLLCSSRHPREDHDQLLLHRVLSHTAKIPRSLRTKEHPRKHGTEHSVNDQLRDHVKSAQNYMK